MQPKKDDVAAVRELQEYITSLDFGSGDLVQDHRDIYDYIERTIIEPKSFDLDSVPPVDVLVYAAKNILFPTFAQELTPHLLDIIATIEYQRQQAVVKSERILDNARAAEGEESNTALTGGDEAYLKRHVASDKSWREVYMTILCKSCHYDLHHQWTTDSPSMVTFMVRFNEYFPFLNKHCTHPSPRLFHQTLSQNEQKRLGETGLAICALGTESAQWVTENINDFPYWNLFQTQSFRKIFPPPCASRSLVKLIYHYLDYVATMVQKVDGTFSEKNQ